MLRYCAIRIALLIPILLCVSFIIFWLIDLAPGEITDTMITDQMTEEDIQILRAKYDLDKPLIVRYGKYIWNLLHGDLGRSQVSNLSVWEQYKIRFPFTLRLSIYSLILGVALAIPAGIFAAKHAGTIWDNITTAIAMLGLPCPTSGWADLADILLYEA